MSGDVTLIKISIDLEIYGDGDGLVCQTVIAPGLEILNALTDLRVQAIFYVEVMHLQILKKHNSENYWKVIHLLRRIINEEQEVGLHVHPQWFLYDELPAHIVPKGEGSCRYWSENDQRCYFLNVKRAVEILKQDLPGLTFSSYRSGGLKAPINTSFYENLQRYFDIRKISNFSEFEAYFDGVNVVCPAGLKSMNTPLVAIQYGRMTKIISTLYRKLILRSYSRRTKQIAKQREPMIKRPKSKPQVIDYMEVCPLILPVILKIFHPSKCDYYLLMHTKNFFGPRSFQMFLRLCVFLNLLETRNDKR